MFLVCIQLMDYNISYTFKPTINNYPLSYRLTIKTNNIDLLKQLLVRFAKTTIASESL